MTSQQAPVRPRFLLASMARPAAAPTAPTPAIQADQVTQPRPTFRPLFTQTFRPPVAQPQPQPQEPTRPPLQQPTPATAPPPAAARAPAPSPAATAAPAPSASPIAAAPAPPSPAAPQPPAPTTLSAPKTSPTSTILQVVSSSLVPQSPTPKVSAASSPASKLASPSPASPPFPFQVPATASTTVSARAATPTSSPTNVKPQATTPSPSPMIRAISHPPSPLTLPVAQLKSNTEKPEVTPKTTFGEPQRYASETYSPSIAQNWKQEVSKDAGTKDKGNHTKFSDYEDFGMRFITIVGENKGAIMELSPSRKKHDLGDNPQSLQMKGNPKAWSDSENSGTDGAGSNGEGNSKVRNKNHKATAKPSPPMPTIMNNNVQGVNNSFLYNSSLTHHDPGVHLSFSRKANGVHGVHQKDRVPDG